MLGVSNIQPEFYDTLKLFLSLKQTVGAIGGKPRSALYLIGYQSNKILFLDPHLVQESCMNENDLIYKLSSFHCDSAKLIDIEQVESSISVGFLLKNFHDFYDFELNIRNLSQNLINIKESEALNDETVNDVLEGFKFVM